MFILFTVNLLCVMIIQSLFLILPRYSNVDFSFIQLFFTLFTPFILLRINYRNAIRKKSKNFIPYFFIVLLCSLVGFAINSYHPRQNPDFETHAMAMLVLKINIIASIIGSIICYTIIIVKIRQNS